MQAQVANLQYDEDEDSDGSIIGITRNNRTDEGYTHTTVPPRF